MTNHANAAAAPLCWICNQNVANSGEHKTKRSDLLAAIGKANNIFTVSVGENEESTLVLMRGIKGHQGRYWLEENRRAIGGFTT